ncbi:hypothetical protein MY04_4612 [Flammeovirga sp. MY04]|uniref:tetratricopeptide repeat protein n=1 Tax=Flammeovirga sp. MY04 TaxID=1191459 RepID=UPI00082514E5|nr:hypothetical protein [Flammeovirga sp. MY04]ANQ51947.2 hypothetical protein MY04_4612 [Flammeovirga sp. MY04]
MLTNSILFQQSKTFIDLSGIHADAELHIWALYFDFQNLVNNNDDLPDIHVFLTSSFRNDFLVSIERNEYVVNDPRLLNAELKTKQWEYLIDKLDSYSQLKTEEKTRLFKVLRRLCFYSLILELSNSDKSCTDDHFNYEILLAKYMLNMEEEHSFSIEELIEYALTIKDPSEIKVKLWYLVCQYYVKIDHQLEKLQHYIKLYEVSVVELEGTLSKNKSLELNSRFHRMNAFVPQLNEDMEGMSVQMTICEDLALKIQCRSSTEEVLKRSILFPIYESRVKEYLIRNDLDRSIVYAEKLIDLQPNSGVGHMLLGQVYAEKEQYILSKNAYLKSARLSPLTAEIAYFMAGQCAQQLNEYEEAITYYTTSLTFDQEGYANYECLIELSKEM